MKPETKRPETAKTTRDRVIELARKYEDRVISMRRALHRIAEPSFEEYKTQAKVCSLLRRAGIPFRSPFAGTGVVAMVGGRGRTTVALRTDMDALELGEETGLPFASEHGGLMHACGHDAHMAMVLGAGMVLKDMAGDLRGNVKLVFQPAEEKPPGGAPAMIEAGVLSNPRVSAMFGIHLWHPAREGEIGVGSGPMSAAADDFKVTIKGKGGHGARPQEVTDSIVVAAEYITALQTIVSRRVDPMESVVVTVGKIRGGSRFNVIAPEVVLEGTARTQSRTLRRGVAKMIREILTNVCRAHGARARLEYIKGYPALICDEKVTDVARNACVEILGKRNVITHGGFEMGGEDIAYFAEKVPTTVLFLGVGRKSGRTYPIHHPRFTFNEKVLRTGVSALALSAIRYLEGRQGA
ncbi:MAG: M20 family metallopeptidase [bacterium]|jgi:amidohydrolase